MSSKQFVGYLATEPICVRSLGLAVKGKLAFWIDNDRFAVKRDGNVRVRQLLLSKSLLNSSKKLPARYIYKVVVRVLKVPIAEAVDAQEEFFESRGRCGSKRKDPFPDLTEQELEKVLKSLGYLKQKKTAFPDATYVQRGSSPGQLKAVLIGDEVKRPFSGEDVKRILTLSNLSSIVGAGLSTKRALQAITQALGDSIAVEG